MSKIFFKPGDDLQWAGALSLFGVEDFTGYSLQCQFRKKSGTSPTPAPVGTDPPLAQGVISWLNAAQPQATFLVEVDKTVTKDWPVNETIFIDVVLIDPSGKVATTETQEFFTAPRVTKVT